MSVVDGANGFVGSNLIRYLLSRGRAAVALARVPGEQVRQAVASAVVGDGVGRAPPPAGPLRVFRAGLDQPDLGLSRPALAEVFAAPCDFWHTAALVTFFPGRRGELLEVNVEGTRRALDTFAEHAKPGSRFFLVSTAYSAGMCRGLVREAWHDDGRSARFRNYYEYSKRAAELLVREAMAAHGIAGAVLRLGQVVGDSRTGRTTSHYGLYDFVRSLSHVAGTRPGSRVRVECEPTAALHLVPVDVCVRWLGLVAGTDVRDAPVWHILDEPGFPVPAAAEIVSRHLPIKVVTVTPESMEVSAPSQVDRLIRARTRFLAPYLTEALVFDRRNLDRLVGAGGPAVSEVTVERLVSRYVAEHL